MFVPAVMLLALLLLLLMLMLMLMLWLLLLLLLLVVVVDVFLLVVRVLGTTMVLDDGKSRFKNHIKLLPQPLQCAFPTFGNWLLKKPFKFPFPRCETFLYDLPF